MSTWVLLRGLTREAAHWGGFVQRFSQVEPGARVITVDLPGTGQWHRMHSPTDIRRITDHVRRQVERHAVSTPLKVLGLSMGGMVAAHWALNAPDEVSHAVMVNTSMRPLAAFHQRLRPGCWPSLLAVLLAWDEVAAEQRILQATSARPADHRDVLPAWVRTRRERPVTALNAARQLLAAARYRLPDHRSAAHLLVAASAADRLVSPLCSMRLAAHWQCPLVMHPSAGHDLPLDAPQWLIAQVAAWLEGPEGRLP